MYCENCENDKFRTIVQHEEHTGHNSRREYYQVYLLECTKCHHWQLDDSEEYKRGE